ncbi:hypothetical protein ACLEPN_18870 [Myxococcus sp. 1LA]
MHFSQSIFTPGSRIRNGSIRAALLMACVATVATSEDNSVNVTQAGAPFALTTEQTRTTRHITVRIAPQSYGYATNLSVTTGIRARWVPDTPVPGEAPPLRVWWPGADSTSYIEREYIPLSENNSVATAGSVYSHHDLRCEAEQECVWERALEFSINNENPGTVDVESWSLSVSFDPNNGKKLPERDVAITISEN